jgi:hypothetical protein
VSLADRILGSIDKLASTAAAREGLPDARYLACWSYSVTSATETTFSGRALSPRCPQPDLPTIPNMPGIPGTLLKPKVGSIVGVMFLDGDPAQPRVVSWDQNTAVLVTVDATTLLKLGPSSAAVQIAGGGPAVHRVGDFGQAGTLTGAGALGYSGPNGGTGSITGSVTISAVVYPVVFAGSASLTTAATTGSGKVTSG